MSNLPEFDGTQACAKLDTDLFFPETDDRAGIKLAKEICNTCNQIDKCLKYAVWRPDLEGIWGGTTQRQRETLRSRLRRQK